MLVFFAVMGLAALAVSLGFFTRVSAAVFCALFTYAELIDKATYLNHYYLASLLALLLVVVPSGATWSVDALRRARTGKATSAPVPALSYWLLRAQVGVVYVYAGLAKLDADWLVRARAAEDVASRSRRIAAARRARGRTVGAVRHELGRGGVRPRRGAAASLAKNPPVRVRGSARLSPRHLGPVSGRRVFVRDADRDQRLFRARLAAPLRRLAPFASRRSRRARRSRNRERGHLRSRGRTLPSSFSFRSGSRCIPEP